MAFDPKTVSSNFGFQDGYQTTLSGSISDTDTAIPLSSLPTPSEGTIVIEPGTANEEEIYYTSKGSGVVNCSSASAGRGVNSTAVSHSSGATVKMLITKASFDSLKYAVTPVGTILATAISTVSSPFLECNGQAVSRTTYAALFAAISTTYGVGDGSTTFNVPNLAGKVIVGLDTADTAFDAMAETGGAKTVDLSHTHTATTASNGAHTHTVAAHTHGMWDISGSNQGDWTALDGNLASTQITSGHGADLNDAAWSGSTTTLMMDFASIAGKGIRTNTATPATDSQGAHTHTLTTASSLSATQSVLQPYMTLKYMIKAY